MTDGLSFARITSEAKKEVERLLTQYQKIKAINTFIPLTTFPYGMHVLVDTLGSENRITDPEFFPRRMHSNLAIQRRVAL